MIAEVPEEDDIGVSHGCHEEVPLGPHRQTINFARVLQYLGDSQVVIASWLLT